MPTVSHLSTRCPRCGDSVSMPPESETIAVSEEYRPSWTVSFDDTYVLYAVLHVCTNKNCAGAVVAYYIQRGRLEPEYQFHTPRFRTYQAPEEIPERPQIILQAANDSHKTPVACVATAVRAVEAMMAEVGYSDRKMGLGKRIETAVTDGILPQAMADWANEVREIGNETHTDDKPADLPNDGDAKRSLMFANTLAQYLFVLPKNIERARGKKEKKARKKKARMKKAKKVKKIKGVP